MALVLLIGLVACAGRDDAPSDLTPSNSQSSPGASTPPSTSSRPGGFANPLDVPSGPGELPPMPASGFTELVAEKHAISSDTRGWLYMPNTAIDEVVVWNQDPVFYLRRNFAREYYFDGIAYADSRTRWGDGNRGRRQDLSRNTVIYGHSMEDIPGIEGMTIEQVNNVQPNNPRNSPLLFTEFKKLLNEQFAKQNPYVFFSTLEEDMIWEIFSVHYSNTSVYYNVPDPDDAAWAFLLQDAKARSLWDYDVDVSASDKIITFSTCIYDIDGIPLASDRDSIFRFVVMARLVDVNAPLKSEASFTRNPNPRSGRVAIQGNFVFTWQANGTWTRAER
jgi:sortase B